MHSGATFCSVAHQVLLKYISPLICILVSLSTFSEISTKQTKAIYVIRRSRLFYVNDTKDFNNKLPNIYRKYWRACDIKINT